MPQPEDPALPFDEVPWHIRLAGWLDWWCTVRWRALLMWVGLAMLIGFVMNLCRLPGRVLYLSQWMWPRLGDLIGFQLPGRFGSFAFATNLYVLMVWMEPFALRLNLRRGVAWVALRTGSMASLSVLPWADTTNIAVTMILLAVLPMGALYRWRTRPWMALVGVGLAFGWGLLLDHIGWPRGMLAWGVVVIPYAAALLYGTRLLRADERMRK